MKLGLALLLVAGIVLGMRGAAGVRSVLSFKGGQALAAGTHVPKAVALSGTMETRDKMLSGAVVASRDPFRPPPAPPQAIKEVKNPKPEPPRPPSVRAFLYDNVNPTVQLGVGADVSGWMRKGDSFQGWTVVEITATTVRVSRGGVSLVLTKSLGGDS